MAHRRHACDVASIRKFGLSILLVEESSAVVAVQQWQRSWTGSSPVRLTPLNPRLLPCVVAVVA